MRLQPGLLDHPLRWRTGLVLLIALVLLPDLAQVWGQDFYVGAGQRAF